MGLLDGKIAFISGLARGQGRSHAVRLAEEGADIIGFDICQQIPTVHYDMPSKADLEETVALVEKTGRRIYANVADVRDHDAVKEVFDAGVVDLGPVDIAVANAGIWNPFSQDRQAWTDAVDVLLTGVYNTIDVVAQPMVDRGVGGSIIITSSTVGLSGMTLGTLPGSAGYAASKHGVIGLMRMYATHLAPYQIRVNTVHPTGVDTPMGGHPKVDEYFEQHPEALPYAVNALPVERVDPVDISNAIVFLASEGGRYITGVTLPIDAGFLIKRS